MITVWTLQPAEFSAHIDIIGVWALFMESQKAFLIDLKQAFPNNLKKVFLNQFKSGL